MEKCETYTQCSLNTCVDIYHQIYVNALWRSVKRTQHCSLNTYHIALYSRDNFHINVI